ncbi:phosphonate ABC transporter, permease protein PhnE [Vagococcus salmoninarum]|uniref:Phosphonate ABC transporter, permease protein PhnE n=1 Tax=Vagococcus salmoninarum TaxID=2739 RepID=A0A429ZND6_9ENTE|nr:phosphonate ABC transporter, permease protein PhnE [Vagococcus salmoninarum]MBE9388477.1 phosphonate ABC transporter, permease protein PhnE [Vagococcus salmoninarum]RST95201.1 phosphonate ABC transporter, permease protein PhnE [Vagococcus salmoninarum]
MKKFLKGKEIQLPNGKTVLEKPSFVPLIVLIVFLFTLLAMRVTKFNFTTLITRGNEFFVILKAMFPPNFEFIGRVWQPLFDTIKMSLLGSLVGALVSVPLALLASANIIKNRFISGFFKLFLSILRTLPTIVTALIATFVFGLGTMAGTLAIFLFTVAYVGKLTYEQIESLDMSTFEALESMGFTRFQAFRYAVIPEIMPTFLSTSLFNFEGNLRYASILGYVGAGGLGIILNERLGWREYNNVGMILVVLIVTVAMIELLSEYCRKKLQ